MGVQSFAGAGAGGFPTASNVLADCLEILGGCAPFYVTERKPCSVQNDGLRQRYYLRTAQGADSRLMTVMEAHALAAEYKNNQQPFFMAAAAEE